MKALDFEYDGTLASSKGIVVCSFDSSDDETIDYGCTLLMPEYSDEHL